MKFEFLLPFVAGSLMLCGCSSMKIKSSADPHFNFSKVRTFHWVEAPTEILNRNDTILNDTLQNLLTGRFIARGWKQLSGNTTADVQVVYYIKLNEHQEHTVPPENAEPRIAGGFTYNPQTEKWNYSNHNPELNVYTVETGELILIIYDSRTGTTVWHGSLKTRLNRSSPPGKLRETLRQAANRITARIP